MSLIEAPANRKIVELCNTFQNLSSLSQIAVAQLIELGEELASYVVLVEVNFVFTKEYSVWLQKFLTRGCTLKKQQEILLRLAKFQQGVD